MRKRAREIAAVVLLVMLGLGVAIGMGWYILVGHNWNVAASNIDDSIGHMDGYTIFLFEGTRQVEGQAHGAGARSSRAAAHVSSESPLPSQGSPANQKESPEAGEGASQAAPSVSATAPETAGGEGDEGRTSLEELAASYREKGAAVFVLDAGNLWRYEEPFVVAKNGMRVGFASEQTPARLAAARVRAKLLARQHADFIVMLTNDPNLTETDVRGVDVMVNCASDGEPRGGYYVGSMYCVDAPEAGEVQAVIVSPSGVVSSKVVEPD